MKPGEKTKKSSKAKNVVKEYNADVKQNAPDRSEFCGKVQLGIDPVAYQKKMRNEWK